MMYKTIVTMTPLMIVPVMLSSGFFIFNPLGMW